MIWLGLLLPACFWAGYTGGTIPTQWIVLWACLPWALWHRAPITPAHRLVFAFSLYACLSIAWSSNGFDSVIGAWKIVTCAMAFWLGSTLPSLRRLWIGLAIGLMISLPVILFQFAGRSPVYYLPGPEPFSAAGLLFNGTTLGAVTALVILGLIDEDLWGIGGMLIPLLWIAHSRGAWLAIGVSLACKYMHWALAAVGLLGACLFFYFNLSVSDDFRLEAWGAAVGGLTVFGRGGGTFTEVVLVTPTLLMHPEFVHNDYLQVVFEYGLGALPWFGLMVWTISRREKYWQVFICFGVLGIFWFPLFSPITAFIGCVVAGHISRSWALVRDHGNIGRSPRSAWIDALGCEADPGRATNFPMG